LREIHAIHLNPVGWFEIEGNRECPFIFFLINFSGKIIYSAKGNTNQDKKNALKRIPPTGSRINVR